MIYNDDPNNDKREHGGFYNRHIVGRSQVKVTIDCPFCNAAVECFLWSVSGGGKKCKCGAVIRRSFAIKPAGRDPENAKGTKT